MKLWVLRSSEYEYPYQDLGFFTTKWKAEQARMDVLNHKSTKNSYSEEFTWVVEIHTDVVEG